ncbi:NAD-dependent epimerase/dehydratase family protein [Streptomyces sp. NPDC020898]|uniref:NAD-dependent epimerase/dehydratase family protein n=1 Tax=Streptomyces sp. NPDC020898 TaxID=3365101 RepID=UPI00378C2D6E
MTRMVVTGGGGFIGSHVVERLAAQGHTVTVVDDFSTGHPGNLAPVLQLHPDVTVHEADIATPSTADLVREARPEVVLLLAAQMSVKVSMRDPVLDARLNVEGLVRMLEAARTAGARKVVFASSGGTIYRESMDGEGPTTETWERVPRSFYGLTKSVALDYLRLYEEVHGLSSAALALGNVYGPRQDPGGEAGVVAIFARRMLRGQQCVVNGDGLTTRDFVHVDDVAEAFTLAAERGSGLINIGTGQPSSVLDIHAALAAATGFTKAPVFGAPLPGEMRHVRLSTERAAEQLGWRAGIDLQKGVDSVVRWVREHSEGPAEVRHVAPHDKAVASPGEETT